MANPKTTVRLNKVRLSFPHLFVASAMNEADKKAFSCQLLVPKDHPQIGELNEAAKAAATGQWGDKGVATLTALVAQGRVFMRDGDTKVNKDGDVMDGYAGNKFISARSYVRPTIIDRDRSPLDAQSGKPYGGCYVNAVIAIWAQDGKWGKRINAQIQGVQFHSDGESFGAGGVANPDAFEVMADEWNDAAADESADESGGLL